MLFGLKYLSLGLSVEIKSKHGFFIPEITSFLAHRKYEPEDFIFFTKKGGLFLL